MLTETGNPQDVHYQIPCKSAHRLSTRGKEEDAAKHTGPFLGAFAKLRKATITFVTSVSVRIGTTRLPLDGFC